jgi:hypothetical protein
MDNKEVDLELLKELCKDEDNLHITEHALMRCIQRGISMDEVLQAIQGGEIIEQYPDDYPNPSCLVLGVSLNGKIVHVVRGTDSQSVWIVTAYVPHPDLWSSNFKTRKER